ncbi:lytic polysaccharide monooxygenase auxiliary activity family 9 protein [Streptomyces sp. 8N616]|uniref:lytic polysaccharide monooxygenase auxiliary activity family 9 protein n=1 Tax=Streptomyces sp. 8N616 TaxID=3457414 RepID=UPI003FCEE9B9
MTAHRTATVAALVGAAPILLTVLAGSPAHAHGAPTDPVSRVVACSPLGGRKTQSAACKAAAATGGASAAWDNLRVADVRGKDRQMIPDGKLCSAGLDAYKGLDLARADWPSTRLSAGANLALTYRSTIPHTGTFELYLTKNGYDPTQPLKWSDLEAEPFATATDPQLVDDAYRIKAKLPSDRTGRHLLYTIWRNSSTPDTYYSCSDVVFPRAKGSSGNASTDDDSGTGGSRADTGGPASADSPAATAPTEDDASDTATSPPTQRAEGGRLAPAGGTGDSDDSAPLPLFAGGAAAFIAAAGTAATLRRRRMRR